MDILVFFGYFGTSSLFTKGLLKDLKVLNDRKVIERPPKNYGNTHKSSGKKIIMDTFTVVPSFLFFADLCSISNS